MVGQAVLRQALLHPTISRVHLIARSPPSIEHAKLSHTVVPDLFVLSPHKADLTGFDAILWCIGITSAGMSEVEYSRVTYEMTVSAANLLLPLNPSVSFIFVSGEGADATEKSRVMWSRVKGRTENAILALSPASYIFRPGVILPLHGIESKTASYRLTYKVAKPLLWLINVVRPSMVTNTTEIGDAMLRVAERGFRKRTLSTSDIREVGIEASKERAATTTLAPPPTSPTT